MPFFFTTRRIFKEADIDGNNQDDASTTNDYTDDAENDTEQSAVESEPQTNDDQEDTDNAPNDTSNVDDQEDTDNAPDDTSNVDDEYTDYTEDDDVQSQEGSEVGEDAEEAPVDDIKRQEEEMYSNMSPEQLDIMHRELKSRFIDIYNICTNTIERLSAVHVSEDNVSTLEYISRTLSTTKDMIVDYIDNIYKSKSYIENNVNYNKYLVIINAVNKMLESIDNDVNN